jgi:hypothetical protein
MNRLSVLVALAINSCQLNATDIVFPPNEIKFSSAQKYGIEIEVEYSPRERYLRFKVDESKLCKLSSVDIAIFGKNREIAAGTNISAKNGMYRLQISEEYLEKSWISFNCDESENKRPFWLHLRELESEAYNKQQH